MIKHEELADPKSCLNKAASNEPVFVLRAQDKCAPDVVRFWAQQASMSGAKNDKIESALDLAAAMESWPHRKWPT